MKPILFNTEMVKAILEGRKTETRRVIKRQPGMKAKLISSNFLPETIEAGTGAAFAWSDGSVRGVPYIVGEILYVREAFACDGFDGEKDVYVYRADVDECDRVVWGDIEKNEWAPRSDYNWHPSIHMPKEAARIFLRVNDVRVERLKEITDKGARSEGCGDTDVIYYNGWLRCEFAKLWDSTVDKQKIAGYGWAANPWVWVIEFERIDKVEAGT